MQVSGSQQSGVLEHPSLSCPQVVGANDTEGAEEDVGAVVGDLEGGLTPMIHEQEIGLDVGYVNE